MKQFPKILFVWCFLMIFARELKTQFVDCSKFEWSCLNKDCIAFNKFCDGRKDCKDGSDETFEMCGKNSCRRHSFQCSYGACIDSSAKCNGIKDCADNSDETPSLCPGAITNEGKGITITLNGGNLLIQSLQPSELVLTTDKVRNVLNALQKIAATAGPTPYMLTTPKAPAVPNTSSIFRRSCQVETFANGIITLRSNSTKLEPGSYADPYSYIEYSCSGRYELEGPNINICEDGKWSFTEPKCVVYCIIETTHTIKLECQFNDAVEPCTKKYKHPVGTLANISCEEGYRRPSGEFVEQLVCKNNGEWDKSPKRCEHICGILSTLDESQDNTTLLAPWNAAIYKKSKTTWYEEFCEGTVLSPKLVISVAHCYWNYETSTLIDLSDLQVVVGKNYNDYYQKGEEHSLYLVVSDIYIPQVYKDKHQDDLALLIITYSLFLRPQARPICIDLNDNNSNRPMVGDIGRVAALGTESNCVALNFMDVPTVNNTECASKGDLVTEEIFTNEEFCVGEIMGLCSIDGAGYAVNRPVNGQKTYFLEGVVKHSINKADNYSRYAVLTSIRKYVSIIREYLTREYKDI